MAPRSAFRAAMRRTFRRWIMQVRRRSVAILRERFAGQNNRATALALRRRSSESRGRPPPSLRFGLGFRRPRLAASAGLGGAAERPSLAYFDSGKPCPPRRRRRDRGLCARAPRGSPAGAAFTSGFAAGAARMARLRQRCRLAAGLRAAATASASGASLCWRPVRRARRRAAHGRGRDRDPGRDRGPRSRSRSRTGRSSPVILSKSSCSSRKSET